MTFIAYDRMNPLCYVEVEANSKSQARKIAEHILSLEVPDLSFNRIQLEAL